MKCPVFEIREDDLPLVGAMLNGPAKFCIEKDGDWLRRPFGGSQVSHVRVFDYRVVSGI